MERQWKEKEAELVQLRQDTRTETERLRAKLASLRGDYDEKLKAYKDLFDLKIKLDQELERYRQLLDAEEERLVLVLFWLMSQTNTWSQQSPLVVYFVVLCGCG